MVEEVRAFRDAKGNLHDNKLLALQADAMVTLMGLGIFNHASSQAIVEHAIEVSDVLEPIAAMMRSAEAGDVSNA